MRQIMIAVTAFAAMFLFAGTASAQSHTHRSSSIYVGNGGFGISINKSQHGRHGGRNVNIDVFSGPYGTSVGVGVHNNRGWHNGPVYRQPYPVYRQPYPVYRQPVYQPIMVQVVEIVVSYEPEVIYDQWGRPCYTGRQVQVTRQVTRTVQASWDQYSDGYYYHDNRGVRCRYNGRW